MTELDVALKGNSTELLVREAPF